MKYFLINLPLLHLLLEFSIGYMDNPSGGYFEIMNSWGEQWGINGFTRIRYVDAANWIEAGWAVQKTKTTNSYRFDGNLEASNDSLKNSDAEMIKIFSESQNDTLDINPFFQRSDLLNFIK
jgi:C1A family cysteine protease